MFLLCVLVLRVLFVSLVFLFRGFSLFLLGVFLVVFAFVALCFVGAFCFLVGFFVCGSGG